MRSANTTGPVIMIISHANLQKMDYIAKYIAYITIPVILDNVQGVANDINGIWDLCIRHLCFWHLCIWHLCIWDLCIRYLCIWHLCIWYLYIRHSLPKIWNCIMIRLQGRGDKCASLAGRGLRSPISEWRWYQLPERKFADGRNRLKQIHEIPMLLSEIL